MSRPESFVVPGLRLEWQQDRCNGWRVTAWKPHVSASFSDRSGLLKFAAWPAKTPTGDLLRGWLDAQIASSTAASPDPTEGA